MSEARSEPMSERRSEGRSEARSEPRSEEASAAGGESAAGGGAAAEPDDWGAALAPDTLRIERLLPGPIERLWAYLTEGEKRARWLAGGETEPRVGGHVDLHFRHADLSPVPGTMPERFRQYEDGVSSSGTVTIWEPPRRLGYTWGEAGGGESEVHFDLSPAGDRVRLVITHHRIPDRATMVGAAGGWHAHLAILRDRLEGRTPPNFWAIHEGLEEEYDRRLPRE